MRRAGLLLGLAACAGGGGDGPPVCERGCAHGAIAAARVSTSADLTRFDTVGVDGFGELVVGGTYRGAIVFGPTITAGTAGDGSVDAFTARVPFDGQPYADIEMEDAGPVALGGFALDFEGGVLALTFPPTAGTAGYVRATAGRYDRNLEHVDLYGTGDPPVIAAASDGYGRPIVAISATDLARNAITLAGPQAVIVRLDQGLRVAPLLAWPGAVVRDLLIGPAGELVVAGDFTGQPDGRFPACATRCGFVATLGLDGGLVWVRSIEDAAPTSLSSVALGLGGQVIALGVGDQAAFLVRYAATGGLVERTALVEDPTTVIDGRELAVGRDGTLFVALVHRGPLVIGGSPHDGQATGDRFDTTVAALAPDGTRRWARLFAGDGTIVGLDLTMVRNFPVLVGAYQGTFAGADTDVEVPSETEPQATEGFLVVMAP